MERSRKARTPLRGLASDHRLRYRRIRARRNRAAPVVPILDLAVAEFAGGRLRAANPVDHLLPPHARPERVAVAGNEPAGATPIDPFAVLAVHGEDRPLALE